MFHDSGFGQPQPMNKSSSGRVKITVCLSPCNTRSSPSLSSARCSGWGEECCGYVAKAAHVTGPKGIPLTTAKAPGTAKIPEAPAQAAPSPIPAARTPGISPRRPNRRRRTINRSDGSGVLQIYTIYEPHKRQYYETTPSLSHRRRDPSRDSNGSGPVGSCRRRS